MRILIDMYSLPSLSLPPSVVHTHNNIKVEWADQIWGGRPRFHLELGISRRLAFQRRRMSVEPLSHFWPKAQRMILCCLSLRLADCWDFSWNDKFRQIRGCLDWGEGSHFYVAGVLAACPSGRATPAVWFWVPELLDTRKACSKQHRLCLSVRIVLYKNIVEWTEGVQNFGCQSFPPSKTGCSNQPRTSRQLLMVPVHGLLASDPGHQHRRPKNGAHQWRQHLSLLPFPECLKMTPLKFLSPCQIHQASI